MRKSDIDWSYFQYDGDELAAELETLESDLRDALEGGDEDTIEDARGAIADLRSDIEDALDDIEQMREEAGLAVRYLDRLHDEAVEL